MTMNKLICLALALAPACVDDTNLGYSPLEPPATRWALTLPGTPAFGMGVAMTSRGDVVVAGSIGGSGFISLRAAEDGAERWRVAMQGATRTSTHGVTGIAVDTDDNVIVTGRYQGTVDVGGQVLSLGTPASADQGDTFVAKYAGDGTLQWVHGLSTSTDSAGSGVTVDANGRIFVTGRFGHGSITLAGTPATNPDTLPDAYLLAFAPDGTALWGQAFHGPSEQSGWSVTIAANGDVVMSGQFEYPAAFGGPVLSPPSRLGVFVTRFTRDGQYVASRSVGIAAGQSSFGWLAAAPTGPITVQTWDVPADPATPARSRVHALDGALDELWVAEPPNVRPAFAASQAGIVGAGTWQSPVDGSEAEGRVDLVAYDAAGNASVGAFGHAIHPGVVGPLFRAAASSEHGLAFVGEHGGIFDFGSGPVSGASGEVLVVALEPLAAP